MALNTKIEWSDASWDAWRGVRRLRRPDGRDAARHNHLFNSLGKGKVVSWNPKLQPWQREIFNGFIRRGRGHRQSGKTEAMTNRMKREAVKPSIIWIETVKPSYPWWSILGGVVATVAVLVLMWLFLIGVFSQ